MLVVISDLHLTDGTSGETISPDAFRIFCDDIKVAISNACFQKAGDSKKFIPIDRCDIVFNGDVLDVIRSNVWRGDVALKPWADPDSETFISAVNEITDKILTFNARALEYLRNLSQGVEISSPEGDVFSVAVNLHYLVGNHDWFYHLPDPRLHVTRSKIITAMGLSNKPDTIIPHTIGEIKNCELEALCLQHKVYIQHGDLHDNINYIKSEGRNYSSLGDAIVVLMLNAFPEVVQEQLKLPADDALVVKLRELDNVRPLYESPAWVYSVLKQYASADQYRQIVKIWKNCLKEMLKTPFVKHAKNYLSVGEKIKFWFQFGLSRYISLKAFVWLAGFASKFLPEHEKSYLDGASNEPWLNAVGNGPAKANYVTYGHTHIELIYPIDEVTEDNKLIDKIYFNSGTWRLVHRRTQKNKKQYEYARYHVMTYLAFYKENERGGRPYETWTGHLGIE